MSHQPPKDATASGSSDFAALSFEEALQELEVIVGRLESGALGLEQSLKEYEQGVRRLRLCHERLQAFERRIELLTGFNAAGEAVTEPFDDVPTQSLEEKQISRSKRRSSRKNDLEGPAALF